MAIKIFGSFMIVFLLACHPKSTFETLEWSSGDTANSLLSLDKIDTSENAKIASVQQRVELQIQTYENIPIEKSYVKKLQDKNGDLLMVRGAFTTDFEKLSRLRVHDFEKSRDRVLVHLKKAFPDFQDVKIEPMIVYRNDLLEPLWLVTYADRSGQLWNLKMNNYLQIKSVVRAGSSFHDTPAVVFPRGPKLSQLQEVILKGLASTTTLSNELVSVQSALVTQGLDSSKPLVFSSQDARFDVVQVFFFLNESLNWFEKKVNLKLPFQIDVLVHLGAPEKTNSAFYYQGKIRLGSGDDQVYSHLPQDPTIVIHESVHAVVDAIAHLPFEGEGGSINEGFADFFTALQLDNPKLGESSYLKGPFRRSVANEIKISEKNGGLYHDSGIVSGVLWDFKEKLGGDVAKNIAMRTLNRLIPSSDLADFVLQLKEVVQGLLKEPELTAARQIFGQRGM